MNVLVIALDAASPLDMTDQDVLVVAPTLNSRLRGWFSDDRAARRRAEERLAACVDRLRRVGVRVDGRLGDPDPLRAIADALASFTADEVVIASHPNRSRHLAHQVATRARDRFRIPVIDTGAPTPT